MLSRLISACIVWYRQLRRIHHTPLHLDKALGHFTIFDFKALSCLAHLQLLLVEPLGHLHLSLDKLRLLFVELLLVLQLNLHHNGLQLGKFLAHLGILLLNGVKVFSLLWRNGLPLDVGLVGEHAVFRLLLGQLRTDLLELFGSVILDLLQGLGLLLVAVNFLAGVVHLQRSHL